MGKRQKVTKDNLASVIESIFDDVIEGSQDGMNKAIHRAALDSVKALKSESNEKVKLTGKYAKGWRTKSRTDNVTGQSETLYNASKPGLTHLLEHGHATRNGGRVAGRPHIAPVEAELVEALPDEIVDNIERNLDEICRSQEVVKIE